MAAILAAYGIFAHDAEDVMQEALLAFVSKQSGVHTPESYLLGILRRRCALHIRERYRERRVLHVDPAELQALAGAALPAYETLDRRLDLAALLDTLPTGQTCVVLLRFLGYSHDEIGAACRRAGPTVRRDSVRAIAKLHARC